MAFDVLKGRQGGRDWSCGISDDEPYVKRTDLLMIAAAYVGGIVTRSIFDAFKAHRARQPRFYNQFGRRM